MWKWKGKCTYCLRLFLTVNLQWRASYLSIYYTSGIWSLPMNVNLQLLVSSCCSLCLLVLISFITVVDRGVHSSDFPGWNRWSASEDGERQGCWCLYIKHRRPTVRKSSIILSVVSLFPVRRPMCCKASKR